jgi:hypothetical protein
MVHVIWKGKGWLVALITFICSLLAEIITQVITKDGAFYQTNPYPISIAVFISGLLTFYLANKLKSTVYKESKNNFHSSHSLFFIPINYWGWILIVISILVFAIRRFTSF